ncbi:hypothetical protein ACLOJK_010622 [Asimina triloba]
MNGQIVSRVCHVHVVSQLAPRVCQFHEFTEALEEQERLQEASKKDAVERLPGFPHAAWVPPFWTADVHVVMQTCRACGTSPSNGSIEYEIDH